MRTGDETVQMARTLILDRLRAVKQPQTTDALREFLPSHLGEKFFWSAMDTLTGDDHVVLDESTTPATVSLATGLDVTDQAILALLATPGRHFGGSVGLALKITQSAASARLKALEQAGRVVRIGNGNVTRFELPGATPAARVSPAKAGGAEAAPAPALPATAPGATLQTMARQQMQRMQPIARLDTKVATLDGLAAITSRAIAAELLAIRDDLTRIGAL